MASYDEHFQAIAQLSDALSMAISAAARDAITVQVEIESYGADASGAAYQKPRIRMSREIRPSSRKPPLPRGGSAGVR